MKGVWITAVAGAHLATAVFAGSPEMTHGPGLRVGPLEPATDGANWTGAYAGAHLGWGDISVGAADGDSAIGGLHVGYNLDFGRVVLGAEFDYDVADIDFGPGNENLDSHMRAKLKVGRSFGRSLAYIAGGISWSNGDIAGDDRTDTGWFGGIGYSHQLGRRWVVGAEVLEHRFDDFDGTGLDADATTATTRMSYRF